jgi:hypothetical protein
VRVADYDGNSEFRFSRHAEASLGSTGLNSAVLRAILLLMRASAMAAWAIAVFWTRLCPSSNVQLRLLYLRIRRAMPEIGRKCCVSWPTAISRCHRCGRAVDSWPSTRSSPEPRRNVAVRHVFNGAQDA